MIYVIEYSSGQLEKHILRNNFSFNDFELLTKPEQILDLINPIVMYMPGVYPHNIDYHVLKAISFSNAIIVHHPDHGEDELTQVKKKLIESISILENM